MVLRPPLAEYIVARCSRTRFRAAAANEPLRSDERG